MQEALHIKKHTIGEGVPLICVPIMSSTKEDIVAEAQRMVEAGVEMIEWRVDAFASPADLNALRGVFSALAPVVRDTVLVSTFRSKGQGGLLQVTPEEQQDIYQVTAEAGVADFVDVEYFAQNHPPRLVKRLQKMGIRVIASHHDFNETPPQNVMYTLLEQMVVSGADILKMAVMPHSAADVLTLLNTTERFHAYYPKVPLITMSMGPMGALSRVAGETFGSCVTFGTMGQASAPGQMPVEDLKRTLLMLHNAKE